MNSMKSYYHFIYEFICTCKYEFIYFIGMSCPSWQWRGTGYRSSPVRTLPVAPWWCNLGRCSRTVAAIKLLSVLWTSAFSWFCPFHVHVWILGQFIIYEFGGTKIPHGAALPTWDVAVIMTMISDRIQWHKPTPGIIVQSNIRCLEIAGIMFSSCEK